QAGPLVRSSYHADEQVNEAAKEKQRQGEAQLNIVQAGPLVRSSYHADEQVNEAAKEKQRQGEAQLN
ncbi:hypothetical protein WCN66_14345, partial [Staphylococcus aureus]